jgi:hypothetical protein
MGTEDCVDEINRNEAAQLRLFINSPGVKRKKASLPKIKMDMILRVVPR